MKALIVLGFLFSIGSSAFAESVNIDCLVNYTSPDGVVKTNVLQSFNGVQEFGAKSIAIGNLTLEVGQAGKATLATGEVRTLFWVDIYDNKYPTARAGEVAPGPGMAASGTYQSTDSKESLSAKCAIAR